MPSKLRIRNISRSLLFFILLLIVACPGCWPHGEDSWRHYTSGGQYPARSPSMSPDGSVIVFSSPQTGDGDIYQINSDGSERIRLTSDPSFETNPILSPDGSTIAFAREADGCRHIWLMDPDGTNQTQLTFGSVLDDLWSFSPDGSELVITRSPLSMGLGMGRSCEYGALNLRTKEMRKFEGFPDYSPDGKSIAYSTFKEASTRNEIWIMEFDGSNKRFLATGYSPRFSPNGDTMLYSTDNSNPGSSWRVIAIDGSSDQQLGQMHDPVFARDGKHIVYLSPSYQREIWKMDIDGTNRTRMVAPAGYIDFLRPCNSGFILKLVTDDRVGDIYVIDTAAWTVERVASMK